MNTILALVIIVVSWAVLLQPKPSMNMLLGALAIVGGITLFAAFGASAAGDYGPIMGVGAFVGTLALFCIYTFFKKKNKS